MDLQQTISIVTLAVLLLGIAGGILTIGRKEQKGDTAIADIEQIKDLIDELKKMVQGLVTTEAVNSRTLIAIEKDLDDLKRRVRTLEIGGGPCRTAADDTGD